MTDTGNGSRLVSLDPDDAVAAGLTLEEALRDYEPENTETHVFSINPCCYLIPSLVNMYTARSGLPIGKLISCAVHVGMERMQARFEREFATITTCRMDIIGRGGDFEAKEFVNNKMKAEFHSSKMQKWAVRAYAEAVARSDRLASEVGLHFHHTRQIAIMGGLLTSAYIPAAAKAKMIDIIKWWAGVLCEKSAMAAKLQQKRIGWVPEPIPEVDDGWECI